jgi:hypothetical protein
MDRSQSLMDGDNLGANYFDGRTFLSAFFAEPVNFVTPAISIRMIRGFM